MNRTKTERDPSPAKLRWYQYRLRTLLLLFPLVAMVTALWVSYECLPCHEYPRGSDAVISTTRFEIVTKGVGDAAADGRGTFQVGGLGWEMGGGTTRVDGKIVIEEFYSYAWGTLSFQINGACFSFRRHAREVVANGRTYRIQNRAVVTIDQQGNVTVEDRPPP